MVYPNGTVQMQSILLDRLHVLHEQLLRFSNGLAVLRKMGVAQMARHLAVALVDALWQVVRDGKVFGIFHL